MLVSVLVPQLAGFQVDQTQLEDQRIVVTMTATRPTAICPVCAAESSRIHSRYQRTIMDLAWASLVVQLRLQVRRFGCPNLECPRAIFAERLDPLVRASARRSQRLAGQLLQLALHLASESAAPLLTKLGMPASAATLLRLQRRTSLSAHPAPQIIAVDEFAFRKGDRYGALIVDLERHQPIELLPDKNAETFAAWLKQQPQIASISRDRDGTFAEGARQGAPQAIQVADRWHLTQNLGDALQRLLARHPAALRSAAQAPGVGGSAEPHEAGAPNTAVSGVVAVSSLPAPSERALTEREQRFREVVALRRQGWSYRRIAGAVQLNWRTLKRYVEAGELPKRGAPVLQATSTLRPYLAYIERRWNEGCQNGAALWREIQALGYHGSYSSMRRALKRFRRGDGRRIESPTAAPPRALSPRQAMWVLVRSDDALSEQERAARARLEAADPLITSATRLAQRFLQLIRQRDAAGLDQWLEDAAASGVAELKRLAASLQRDYAAVRAALELDWSQGQVEGQINRLKVIKRVGYGRAKFDLLRQRVLTAS